MIITCCGANCRDGTSYVRTSNSPEKRGTLSCSEQPARLLDLSAVVLDMQFEKIHAVGDLVAVLITAIPFHLVEADAYTPCRNFDASNTAAGDGVDIDTPAAGGTLAGQHKSKRGLLREGIWPRQNIQEPYFRYYVERDAAIDLEGRIAEHVRGIVFEDMLALRQQRPEQQARGRGCSAGFEREPGVVRQYGFLIQSQSDACGIRERKGSYRIDQECDVRHRHPSLRYHR